MAHLANGRNLVAMLKVVADCLRDFGGSQSVSGCPQGVVGIHLQLGQLTAIKRLAGTPCSHDRLGVPLAVAINEPKDIGIEGALQFPGRSPGDWIGHQPLAPLVALLGQPVSNVFAKQVCGVGVEARDADAIHPC